MLTGPELGSALARAIELKKVSKAAVARHFGVKPPSIQDWISRGVIAKQHLQGIWDYFSDVVPLSHWGVEPLPIIGSGAQEFDEFAHQYQLADPTTRVLALAAAKAVFDEAATRRKASSALQRAERAISELSDDEALLLYARLTGPAVDDGEVERRMPVTKRPRIT